MIWFVNKKERRKIMKEVKVIVENKKQEAIAKGSCWCPWTSQTVMFINF